jgi:hypothetical protein
MDGEVDDVMPAIERLRADLGDDTVTMRSRVWAYLLVALASYRDGDFAEAMRCIQEVRNTEGVSKDSVVGVTATAMSVMARHANGEEIESLDDFGDAVREIEGQLSKLAAGEVVLGWHDWLIARIRCQEAAQLLGEPALKLLPESWKTGND